MPEPGLIEILDNNPNTFPREFFNFAETQPPILPPSPSTPSNLQLMRSLEALNTDWHQMLYSNGLSGEIPISYHYNPITYRPYRMSIDRLPVQELADCVPIMLTNLIKKVPGHEQKVFSYQALKRTIVSQGKHPQDLASYLPLLKELGIFAWNCGESPAGLSAAVLMKAPLIAIASKTWHAYSIKAHSTTELTFQRSSSGNTSFQPNPYLYAETTDKYADGTVYDLSTILKQFSQNSLTALLPLIN